MVKVFRREFWGSVLIWLGALLFLVVIYDSVRTSFPPHPQSSLMDKWQRIIDSYLPYKLFKSQAARRRQPGRRPPRPRPPRLPAVPGQLTSDILRNRGQYNLWAWGIKPELKPGAKIRVEAAHAAAGERGGFSIVAYADTDNNGKPDREIARSKFLISERPGQSSFFEFTAAFPKVYVGYTWPPNREVWIYRQTGSWPGKYSLLEDRFYHKISPHQAVSAGPAFTNLKVDIRE